MVDHLFGNLKWALYLSRFVFRFTPLAYETLKRYPELATLYLQVLEGENAYQGFVTEVKERIRPSSEDDSATGSERRWPNYDEHQRSSCEAF